MSSLPSDVRILLAQAANFARRDNFADAVARAKTAHSLAVKAGDATAEALATQAIATYEAAFEAWNAGIAERRARRIENAVYEERKPLPAVES